MPVMMAPVAMVPVPVMPARPDAESETDHRRRRNIDRRRRGINRTAAAQVAAARKTDLASQSTRHHEPVQDSTFTRAPAGIVSTT